MISQSQESTPPTRGRKAPLPSRRENPSNDSLKSEEHRVVNSKHKRKRKKKTKSKLSESELIEKANQTKSDKENSDPNQPVHKRFQQFDSSHLIRQLDDAMTQITVILRDNKMHNKAKMYNICQTYLSIQQLSIKIIQSKFQTKNELTRTKVKLLKCQKSVEQHVLFACGF